MAEPFAPASPGQRLRAFGWDYLVIFAYGATLAAVALSIFAVTGQFLAPTSAVGRDVFALALLVLPVIVYFAVSEASATGQTIGKRRVGIRAIRPDNDRVGLGQSFVRSSLKFLPWQIAHTCLFHIPGWPAAVTVVPMWVLGGYAVSFSLVAVYLGGILSPSGRTLYDRLSGVSVVRS